jgi:NADPH2:quinone reductase
MVSAAPVTNVCRAILLAEQGAPEVLRVSERPLAPPEPGEVRVRHTAIGVNFIDVYHRSGAYPLSLPIVLGTEAVGVVEADASGFKAGERVAYYERKLGAYCDVRHVAAGRLLRIPNGLDDKTVAALLVKGLTAEYLLRRVFRVDARHTLVVHAAAGGVGTVLCQWARSVGAKVIGLVSTDDKAAVALSCGAHHALVTKGSVVGLAARVRDVVGGGVDVVYDSVGHDTFSESLEMLKPRGMMVSFGQSSGPVAPFAPALLSHKGSLFLTRPALHDYVADPGEYKTAADALFDAIKRGAIVPHIYAEVPLNEAARAHTMLESRKTTGSVLLVP